MTTTMHETRRTPTRTCVGCGQHDEIGALVRLVLAPREGGGDLGGDVGHARDVADAGDVVAIDLAGGTFGRGAHVHARPECLARAPRGLRRSLRRDVALSPTDLAERFIRACDQRMAGLLMAARRLRRVIVGTDAALGELGHAAEGAEGAGGTGGAGAGGGKRRPEGGPPLLLVVAVDAGRVAQKAEVEGAVRAGRAIAWRTKSELGALLGAGEVALCAVRHESIAAELQRCRAMMDAALAVAREQPINGTTRPSGGSPEREEAGCSPEAR